ncbi:MAG: acylglycerol kinase family protein, partial [Gemmatimonadota bacterium]|nr:acylglycerol kinase family protein [Gemmatimonadota bacterium]
MSVRFSRVLFIANPHAGVHRNIRSRVIATCEKAGMDFALEVTQYVGHATELAASASEMGFDLVVAIGGDGTINEVGSALLGTEIPLGVVPAGSGNAFARALNLSLDPAKACRAFIQPEIRRLCVRRVCQALLYCP